MSALLMGEAFYVPTDTTSKLVLLALADHADDDGFNARPGNARLAIKAGIGQRGLRIVLAHLESHGLIERHRYSAGGHGRAVEWRVRPERLHIWRQLYKDDPDLWWDAQGGTTVPPSEKNPELCDRKGCTLIPKTRNPGSSQPSGTIMNPDDSSIPKPEGGIVAEFKRRIAVDN